MPIEMTSRQIGEIVRHALEGLPNEVCGLLAGEGNRVSKVLPMGNTEPSPVSYYMDSGEQFRAQRWMRTEGLSMVGIYHSHPVSAPVPSEKDVALAAYPEAVYVIVGLGVEPPDVRAYRIDEGRVEREDIVVYEQRDTEDNCGRKSDSGGMSAPRANATLRCGNGPDRIVRRSLQ